MKLQTKYALALITVVVTVVLLLAGTLLYDFRRALEETARFGTDKVAEAVRGQVQENGLEITRLLADSLVNPLYQYDMEAMRRLLRDARKQPNVRSLLVYDADGRVVHDGSRELERFGQPMEDPFGRSLAAADGPLVNQQAGTLEVAVPIRLGDRRLGGLRIGFSLEVVQREVSELRERIDALATRSRMEQFRSILEITLALILLGSVLAMVVARGLSRPIRLLANIATRIGSGDREVAIPVQRSDELGELAGAFGSMRDSLRHTTVSRDFLDTIIGSLNDALVVTDAAGTIRMVNRAACELLERGEAELVGSAVTALTPQPHPSLWDPESAEVVICERILETRSGRTLPVAISRSPLRGAGGYAYIIQDITERRRHQEHLLLAAGVFDNSLEGILVLDPGWRVRQTNPAFSRITGYEGEALAALTLESLVPASERELLHQVRAELAQEGRWQGELFVRRSDGGELPVWLTLSTVAGAGGEVQFYAGVFSDLSTRKEAEERIYQLAYYDHLTGLPNRILFRDRLTQAVHQAGRRRQIVALLYLDLDRFKIINDTRGHAVGDELLKQVAGRLSRLLRREDTFARLGGDEFAVICPELEREDGAALIARKLIEAFARPFEVGSLELFTGTSIGISLFPVDAADAEGLLKNADAAMYKAKELGRNTYQYFTPELNSRVLEHVELEAGLRQALERQEFQLHYQPQVDLKSGEFIGVEALLRWIRPGQGMVSPVRFIPVAEDSGLIVPIGEWVLREACRQASAWLAAGVPLKRMAVNLSPRQFREPNLLRHVEAALHESGLAPHLLEVEITESLLMEDLDKSIATLIRLNEMGVRISVDDFGTGYSSLSYLKRFPIHTLKIDKTFVRDLGVDADDAAITRAIITMAHSLGLKVLAEGVETIYQQLFLAEEGCDFAQGFFYSRPVPAADCARVLADESHAALRAEAG